LQLALNRETENQARANLGWFARGRIPSGPPEILHSRSLLGPLRQSVADLIAAEADVSEIPVGEMAQGDKRRLTLATRDRGGNPAVDEVAEARQ
jgi:hypothetical protein